MLWGFTEVVVDEVGVGGLDREDALAQYIEVVFEGDLDHAPVGEGIELGCDEGGGPGYFSVMSIALRVWPAVSSMGRAPAWSMEEG